MKRDSIIIQREKGGDMIKEIKNKEDLDPETRIIITKAETMTFEWEATPITIRVTNHTHIIMAKMA